MANRLEPVNLSDFRGGLNLRRDQLQIQATESPEMENIALDVEGGIRTRFGFQRVNDVDIVDPDVVDWDPQRAWVHQLADGTDSIYIANDGTVLYSDAGADFADLGAAVAATPHLADFAVWGDDLYIAAGRTLSAKRRRNLAAVSTLTNAGVGTWNDDYETPVHDVFPRAELVCAHAGYLFVANTQEDATLFPNRLRWSHPLSPDDWATDDYMDINDGGSKITALISFQDHLLIFKPDSIWALYGYDIDTWQLVRKSNTNGAISPLAVTRSEGAAFWYSPSERGAIFSYTGEQPDEIGYPIRPALQDLITHDAVCLSWIGRKLWASLPWQLGVGAVANPSDMLVWDPTLSETGAWMRYTSAEGTVCPFIGGSNIDSLVKPMGVLTNAETPCIVYLEAIDDMAVDRVWTYAVLGGMLDEEEIIVVTDGDEDIEMSGMPANTPFNTVYRTSWINADWPTRRKSWRRPDFICVVGEADYQLRVESFRDYNHITPSRAGIVDVTGGGAGAQWGEFEWGDGTLWGQGGSTDGSVIRRMSSFGLARAIQIRIAGLTPGARWGVNGIVAKVVMRRFR